MAKKFKYTARSQGGKNVSGTLEAGSEAEVISELRKKGLVPMEIKPAGGGLNFNITLGKKEGGGSAKAGAKKGEVVLFTRQLSTMLSSGIPLLEALEVLGEQAESPQFRNCLAQVTDDIRGGADLSMGLSRHPKVFSDIYVSMIKAGEMSGQLDIILQRLAEYQEAAQKLKGEIKSAMTYPVVSLVLVFGIAGFLMVGIVPQFRPVFASLDIDLPGVTQFILSVSDFCKNSWHLILGGIFGLFAGITLFKKTPKGRYLFDKLMLQMPIFGPLFRKVSISRFARTFSTLVKSGVPILGAMEIVSETTGNMVLSRAIDEAKESVKEGDTLAEPLARSQVFPPMVTKMIGIGERSGSLENLLEKISEFYDEQVSQEVKGLTSLIEPIMIGIMGIIVGGIVLAIFLPIFKLQEKLAHPG